MSRFAWLRLTKDFDINLDIDYRLHFICKFRNLQDQVQLLETKLQQNPELNRTDVKCLFDSIKQLQTQKMKRVISDLPIGKKRKNKS